MGFKGNLPGFKPSQTGWELVKEEIAEEAPVSYDPIDSDDRPAEKKRAKSKAARKAALSTSNTIR
jgi:hypothetical protein